MRGATDSAEKGENRDQQVQETGVSVPILLSPSGFLIHSQRGGNIEPDRGSEEGHEEFSERNRHPRQREWEWC